MSSTWRGNQSCRNTSFSLFCLFASFFFILARFSCILKNKNRIKQQSRSLLFPTFLPCKLLSEYSELCSRTKFNPAWVIERDMPLCRPCWKLKWQPWCALYTTILCVSNFNDCFLQGIQEDAILLRCTNSNSHTIFTVDFASLVTNHNSFLWSHFLVDFLGVVYSQ